MKNQIFSDIYIDDDIHLVTRIEINIKEPPVIEDKYRDFINMNHKDNGFKQNWFEYYRLPKIVKNSQIKEIQKKAMNLIKIYNNKIQNESRNVKYKTKNKYMFFVDDTKNRSNLLIKNSDFVELSLNYRKSIKNSLKELILLNRYIDKLSQGNYGIIPKREQLKVKKFLKSFIEEPNRIFQIIEKQMNINDEIIKLKLYYDRIDMKEKKRYDIYNEYKNDMNSDIKYHKFIEYSRMIGIKYLKIKENTNNHISIKNQRIHFIEILIDIFTNELDNHFFFDITSLSNQNFKKFGWSNKSKPNSFKSKFRYNCTHLLMLISINKVISFQFVKGTMNSDIVHNFISNSIKKLRATDKKLDITIILDNSPLHKTKIFKAMSIIDNVKFIFIIPNNPYLNMIEYLFRFLKSGLRKVYSLR